MIKYSILRRSSLSYIKLLRIVSNNRGVASYYSYRFDGGRSGEAITKAAAIEQHNWNRFYSRMAKDCI